MNPRFIILAFWAEHAEITPAGHIIALLVLIFYIFAASFVFLGGRIIAKLKPVVELRRVRNELSATKLQKPISKNTSFDKICSRLLSEHLADGEAHEHASMQIGSVVDIVHYRHKAIKKITKELQIYAFLVTILGVIGFLKALYGMKFQFEWGKLWHEMASHPFELLAFFEFLMFALFSFRLIIEVMTLKELLDD
jgi:hypothetical protein